MAGQDLPGTAGAVGRRARWATQRVGEVLRDEGPVETARRGARFLAHRLGGRPEPARPVVAPVASQAARRWPASLTILAAPDIPQCFRYRVQQKVTMARSMGLPLIVADLRYPEEAWSRLQLGSAAIIYRQAWSPALERFVAEARRLGQPIVFETDDLVHRRDLVAANPNLQTVPEELRSAVIEGADGYLEALRHSDHVIASTQPLAADLAPEVAGSAFVIENGIDDDILAMVDGIGVDPPVQQWLRKHRDEVVITYGSGSRAHDADLQIASEGLRRVMERHAHVELKLIGPLSLPENLSHLSNRVLRAEAAPLGDYLRELAMSHITIAPLDTAPFNRFKSQVKYLEAGVLRRPLVASPTVYQDYVVDGRTALLARSDDEWAERLEELVVDTDLRRRLSDDAWEHVQTWRLDSRPGEQFAAFAAQILQLGRSQP